MVRGNYHRTHGRGGKVRYAVVGLGHIAQVAVLPAFAHAARNSELTALVSDDPSKHQKLSKKYNIDLTLEGVEEVRQLDDTHLHWAANIGGKRLEWDATITEQIPDNKTAWHSDSKRTHSGVVYFDPIEDDDPTSRRMMEEILAVEEEHADDLVTLLEELGPRESK